MRSWADTSRAGGATSRINSIDQSAALQTIINQATKKAVINWQEFDIPANELVKFVQAAGNDSVTLNRVLSNKFSNIQGALEANGNICIGTLDRGGITVVAPTGAEVGFVPVPGDTHITNLCFGGPGLRKAYVTQSYAGRLVEIDWPRPGLPLTGTLQGDRVPA